MILDPVRLLLESLLHDVRVHLAHLSNLEPLDPTTPLSAEAKIQNGMFYIHLYAAIEKTINETVERTLTYISASTVPHKHVKISFAPISLHPHVMSLRDVNGGKMFEKSSTLFAAAQSADPITINNTCMSMYLQNIWTNTIHEIFDAFGIPRLEIGPQTRLTVDEIVDNRNKIAHGRERPLVIGERHRTPTLRVKTDEITSLLYKIIDKFENFYATRGFIKPSAKRYYNITP